MGGARECAIGALLVAAMVVAACGDVTRNDKSDSGGVGADSSSGTDGAGTGAAGAVGGAGVSSSGEGGDLFPAGSSSSGPPPGPDGCVDQLTCYEVVNGGDPSGLCVGGHGKALFDAMWQCMCVGPCATLCAATLCQGLHADDPCYACITDDGEDGCWQELEACYAG